MPRHTTRPPSGNSSPRPGHRAVYGRGYRRARAAAFKRSKGLCQHCGLRPAVEAHHYALKYPDDGTVTADDLTALCLLCHWSATFRRALDRVMGAGTWVILAAATRPAGGRKPAPRHQPRACGPEPEGPGLDLRTLVERCRLQLFVGCLACERFVKLDGVAPLQALRVAGVHQRASAPPVLLQVPQPHPVGAPGGLAAGRRGRSPTEEKEGQR